MKSQLFYCFPLVGLLAACPPPPCESAFDCDVGESCVEGTCVVVVAPEPSPVVEPEEDAGLIPDAGSPEVDAGLVDGGLVDGGADGGLVDGGADGGLVDGGPDGGLVDAGRSDAGILECEAGTWDDDANPQTACVQYSNCTAGSFVQAEGGPTTDRACSACVEDSFSVVNNAIECVAKTICVAGQGVASDGGGTADRICSPCVGSFSTTANATCIPWADCSLGEETLGTATSDVICVPEPVKIVASMGGLSSCALVDDGTIKCWGANYAGQLGDGTLIDRNTPGTVQGLSSLATQVVVGSLFACALLANETVMCWGRNEDGQLGDGTLTERLNPVSVSGLTGVNSISAGFSHVCAVLNDGTAKCWGRNSGGQLGDGTTTNRAIPAAVQNLSAVEAMSGGSTHTCALLTNGTVKCWGVNLSGELGDGTGTQRLTPVTVGGGLQATSIATGADFSCMLTGGQGAFCWGGNAYGQLGNGGTAGSSSPQQVSNLSLSAIAAIQAADTHACVRLIDGTARCWGFNSLGQVGDGSIVNRSTPVMVSGLAGATALSAGSTHTCAVLNDGTARCWGYNGRGQLGDGTAISERTTPTEVVWP